jgi:tetratricopeptide (TPR) repeat protein
LAFDQGSAEVYLLLARAHRRQGNLERARAFLRQAEKSGGDTGRIQRETWLITAQAGDLHAVAEHLPELLASPGSDGPDICEAFVQGYFANLLIDEAFGMLDAWQQDYPDDPQAHWMEGYLSQALALDDRAMAAYRRGLQLAPHRIDMRRRLAEVLLEAQQTDEALGLLRQCLAAAPEDLDVLTVMADALVQDGNLEQAESMLRRVIEKDPANFAALRQLGEILLTQGEFEAAARQLEQAFTLRSYDTTTHNALGRALRALGKDEEAEPHFKYVAEAEQSLANLERQLRQVVERPNDVELRYQIGLTLMKYGSPEDGRRWLRTVLQLDPDHAAARELLVSSRGG